MEQKLLFPEPEIIRFSDKQVARSGTFQDNMKLPIHNWFRYSAGYSAEWVKDVLLKENLKSDSVVLDPFGGSGTTMLSATECGFQSVGFERHSFINRIAKTKINWFLIDAGKYRKKVEFIVSRAMKNIRKPELSKVPLLCQCYSDISLGKLESLKREYYSALDSDDFHEDELIWLTLTSVLRSTSDAGTAQWQYILPNKKKKNVKEPFDAFLDKADKINQDIISAESLYKSNNAAMFDYDARQYYLEFENKFNILITSPPYPNNYDYADATRLEMLFWDEINGWGDLQEKVRKNLIRSCSQHTAAEKLDLNQLLADKKLNPIINEITEVCCELAKIRLEKGGRKTYHTMIAAYYLDMVNTFFALRKMMKPDSKMCFVIGDSAPYGIYAPADNWLIKLAISAGFKDAYFEKIRDRNIKWKNRKHNVPLKEGRLWIKG